MIDTFVKTGSDLNTVTFNDNKTALYRAIAKGHKNIILKLLSAGADINRKTSEGLICLDEATVETRCFIITNFDFTVESLREDNYRLWFGFIKTEGEGIDLKILAYATRFSELCSAKNADGLSATDAASFKNRKAIESLFLWHGRYRISQQALPEHQSQTSVVFKAIDENADESKGEPKQVALKLMRLESQFNKELDARSNHHFNPSYIVEVLRSYSPCDRTNTDKRRASLQKLTSKKLLINDFDLPDNQSSIRKNGAESMYCIVMPFVDRNMFVAMKQDRFTGKDMEEVKYIFRRLIFCVRELHDHGILHGDIKPLNICRGNDGWKLIDLDAVSRIGAEFVGDKCSTAYIPPEGLYKITSSGSEKTASKYVVRNKSNLKGCGLSDAEVDKELIIAHPSWDTWALGCILYQLCNEHGRPLFEMDQDDNLFFEEGEIDNLEILYSWPDNVKQRKMLQILDPVARNLVSQLLYREDSKRPSLERVLAHSFLTSKSVARLPGEPANFDIFLSYRVKSDLHHAERVYNDLKSLGIRVWWDRRSLEPGLSWKDGFCHGLLKSRFFVCLISRNSINNTSGSRIGNFSDLTEFSPCDNVLLEYRLALELKCLGFIEKVFPVFIGDIAYDTLEMPIYGNFFQAGCIQRLEELPDLSVTEVETTVNHIMDEQGLGEMLSPDRSVRNVVSQILSFQGISVEGEVDKAFSKVASEIQLML